jgi:hypothetical protein
MIPGFIGSHDLRAVGGGNWTLLKAFTYVSMDGSTYEAPQGSLTDGASTALFFGHFNLFPTAAQATRAATLHDVHYRTGYRHLNGVPHCRITRKQADLLFKEALEVENLYLPAWYGYIGLRLFGWFVWNKYRNK